MATQALATRDTSDYGKLRNQLDTRAEDFKMALPAHISPEKFQRTLLTAAQSNPELLKADRGSLITSAMKAAQDGLLPDGREAAIVTFVTNKKVNGDWQKIVQAQYMPMAFGLRKKILQSGEISSLETNVVYRREAEEGAFIFEAGTEAMLRHRPMLDLTDEDLNDDNIVAAYSVATMKDGTKSFEVMRRAEINKVRQASQTGAVGKTKRDGTAIPPKGPWVDWFAEMARKTVMRRHSKTLPMSGDLLDVEAADEALAARSSDRLLAVVPDEPTVLPSREEAHDPVTGEVLDEETQRELDAAGLRAMDGNGDEDEAGKPDDQRGEPDSTVADAIITEIDLRTTVPDINSYMATQKDVLLALSDDDRNRVAAAQQARVDEIKAAA
jgi:recombination protein RecT